MGHVSLRPAGTADEPFLYRVYASTRTTELALTGWDDAGREMFLRMQYRAQDQSHRARHPDAARHVVVVDGDPAGRLYVDRTRPTIHLVEIALLPEYRGRGIGTHLLAALLAEAAASERAVTLSVLRANPALHLYERLGFTVTDEDEVYLHLIARPAVR